jgi:hypothetical protein
MLFAMIVGSGFNAVRHSPLTSGLGGYFSRLTDSSVRLRYIYGGTAKMMFYSIFDT